MKINEIVRLIPIISLLIVFSDALSQPNDMDDMQYPSHIKQIGLAFDNFSNPHFVNEAMGSMAKYDIKSTWYVNGEEIQKKKIMLNKLTEKGHEIGNRGMGDEYLTTLTPEAITQNIIEADKLILDITGKRSATFMAPYQSLNDTVWNVLNTQDLPVFSPTIIVNYKEANTCEGTTMYLQYLMSEIEKGSSILFTEQYDNLIILRHLLRMLNEKRYEVLPISKLGQYSSN